jgi:hypothetical protein
MLLREQAGGHVGANSLRQASGGVDDCLAPLAVCDHEAVSLARNVRELGHAFADPDEAAELVQRVTDA